MNSKISYIVALLGAVIIVTTVYLCQEADTQIILWIASPTAVLWWRYGLNLTLSIVLLGPYYFIVFYLFSKFLLIEKKIKWALLIALILGVINSFCFYVLVK